jgi:transaldolase
MNALDQLKKVTTVVIDTGEIDEIEQYKPVDATTNPALILAAATKPEYQEIVRKTLSWGKRTNASTEDLLDALFVDFGIAILKIIPGRVSTEIDSRLSFNVIGSVERARHIISLYRQKGIPPERVLIKLAATWEGIQAAAILEKEGIHCNMTLIFSLAQAISSAEVGVTLVSPFVGRILDWYKEHTGQEYSAHDDPGVQSVERIYNYYKKHGYTTEVMGASFRNVEEILQLAGCDCLTLQPQFLKELRNRFTPIERKLDRQRAQNMDIKKIELDEEVFRWMLCNDPMATEKLNQGIVSFTRDIQTLEKKIKEQFSS